MELNETDVVRHTNVISVRIPKTIVGTGTWPEVPSSFTDIEQNIIEANSHPPIPGIDGYWQIWDAESDCYKPSAYPLPDAAANAVYVPHVSDKKILSFTIENHPTDVPEPVDLNPNDEWSTIDDDGVTDYMWETL